MLSIPIHVTRGLVIQKSALQSSEILIQIKTSTYLRAKFQPGIRKLRIRKALVVCDEVCCAK